MKIYPLFQEYSLQPEVSSPQHLGSRWGSQSITQEGQRTEQRTDKGPKKAGQKKDKRQKKDGCRIDAVQKRTILWLYRIDTILNAML